MQVEFVADGFAGGRPQQRADSRGHPRMLGCQGIRFVEAGMITKALPHRKLGHHVNTQRLQVGGRPTPERNRIAGLP